MKFDDKSKANILQDQFAKVFTVETDGELKVHKYIYFLVVYHLLVGSRIIAVRLTLKDVRNKGIDIYLVSAYAPIGVSEAQT